MSGRQRYRMLFTVTVEAEGADLSDAAVAAHLALGWPFFRNEPRYFQRTSGGQTIKATVHRAECQMGRSIQDAAVAPAAAVVAPAGSGTPPPAADAASPGGFAAPGAPLGRGERLDGDLSPARPEANRG